MLVQVDGSHHPLLEERGPGLSLLLAVDVAVGMVAGRDPLMGGLECHIWYSGPGCRAVPSDPSPRPDPAPRWIVTEPRRLSAKAGVDSLLSPPGQKIPNFSRQCRKKMEVFDFRGISF